MEYQKKSYKLFMLWIVFLFIILFGGGYLTEEYFPNTSISFSVKFEIILLNVALIFLFYIMYKTERIYWINGMSYEKAKSMTSEQRKKYALEHLKLFFKGTIISFVYCIISYFLKISTIIDILVMTSIIIISAIRSISIKV